MRELRIAPIVEGHAETIAIGLLLRRIGIELCDGSLIRVEPPVRFSRSQLERPSDLLRAVDLAQIRLDTATRDQVPGCVLILIDSDPDPRPPCETVQPILDILAEHRSHLDIACVLAHPEWETWFVAAAQSLRDHLALPTHIPEDPESSRSAKAWIEKHKVGRPYKTTLDQPKLTKRMDLAHCRERSPSFDKLCREIEKRLPARSSE